MRWIHLIAAAAVATAVATAAAAQTSATPPAKPAAAPAGAATGAPAAGAQPTDTASPKINVDDAMQNKRQHLPCEIRKSQDCR